MTTRTSRSLARVGPRPLGWLGLLAVLLLLLPLAACAGGGDPASSAADSAGSGESGESGDTAGSASGSVAEPESVPESAVADDAGTQASTGSTVRGRSEPMQRAVVSTGQVSLRSDDVARDRAEALRLVTTYGGLVADEETGTDDDGRARFAVLTLRVPSARFDTAMAALADIGALVEQSRSSEDVTTEVVDVQARVRAQDRSVRRIEALLAEATSLREVVSIEGDLARRQADLDSLRAQQAYLDDQTSLSTISVSIDAEKERRAAAPATDDEGFLAGLRGGWSALGSSAAVLLTVVGAVLPFVVLAGLVAVPTAAVVRRRRTRGVTAEPV